MPAAGKRVDRWAMIAGPIAVVALVLWFAGWSGPDRPTAAADAVWILLTSGPWAAGWLLAATGYGWPLRRLLVRRHADGPVIQLGLGVAVMMTLDAALGALGVLQWGGRLGAWAVVLIGMALAIEQLRRWRRGPEAGRRNLPLAHWLTWVAAPAMAVALLAACSAPGWLWASEFGGYDALSYHLQLPKEWLSLGRIQPLNHNVYSFLPSYMEAAYYHLAVLIGDGIAAVYACQLLHAALTLMTAGVAGRIASHLGGPIAAAATIFAMLGTPWVIVGGSLGYNEMALALFLATGLLVFTGDSTDSPRSAAALGLLAAAACGAKLTAAGFVAAPLGLLMLINAAPRRWPGLIAAALATSLVCLLPYLLRNWAYSGNPVFPFATGLFGLGHWTADQAAIWGRGHLADIGLRGRLVELWNQLGRYGLGPNPDPAEPWQPQWSVLPWLTVAALILGVSSPPLRRWSWRLVAVLAVQTLFWLLLTHIKSRFMLPAVVPASIAVGVGLGWCARHVTPAPAKRAAVLVLAAGGLVWSWLPVAIFAGEAGGAPAQRIGWADLATGEGLSPSQRRELADQSPIITVNFLLPDTARVLLAGDAAPLYYRGNVTYQTTWDRGPLSWVMRKHPDDPAAWWRELRADGFTHLLVEPTMLRLWEESNWNDPQITANRVITAADRFGELTQKFPNGVRLYRLP